MTVFLHGFTGAPADWDRPGFAPPLLGHSPDLMRPASNDDEVERLAALIRPLAPVALVGYSLGARLALGLVARHPALFLSATLIAVNPGLASPRERRERVAADEQWARLLETEGITAFVNAWERQPLFASQARVPADRRARLRARRLAHDPAGLAAALRGLGLGVMPDLWPALPSLAVPVTFLAGALDEKFSALAARAAAATPGAALRVVPDAGHDLLLEKPQELP